MPAQQIVDTTGDALSRSRPQHPEGGQAVSDAVNGDQAAGVARLLQEFGERLATTLVGFRESSALLRQAADDMGASGTPPGYQLLQKLGDCHRQFARLRLDLTRRATDLGIPLPALDQIDGLTAVSHWLGYDSSAPAAPSPEVSALHPTEAPHAEQVGEVVQHDVSSPPPMEAVPEQIVPSTEPPFVEPTPTAVAPEMPIAPSPVAPELFEGRYAPAQEVQPEPVPTYDTPEPTQAPIPEPEPESVHEPIAAQATPVESEDEPLRRQALHVLDKALRLTTRDGADFPPLTDFLDDIASLREAIEAAPPGELPIESHRLAEGTHPVCGLLTVIEGVAGLNDAQWADLHSQVSEAFGRQMAVAAARGRIVAGS